MSTVRADDGRSESLTATIAKYDGRPDICTLHPVDPGNEATTAWISAEEGSFYSLLEVR